jgi:hypothetical protein
MWSLTQQQVLQRACRGLLWRACEQYRAWGVLLYGQQYKLSQPRQQEFILWWTAAAMQCHQQCIVPLGRLRTLLTR